MPDKKIIEELRQQSEDNLLGWKRALADYENFKREQDKRQLEMQWFTRAAIISELLPFFDNFSRAVSHIPQEQQELNWVVGLKHMQSQTTDILKNIGLAEIRPETGAVFDPQIHEAVDTVHDQAVSDHTITKVITVGYLLDGKLLRPAGVIVNAHKEELTNES
ncbi:MAG: nucleotide exchange factor GrpE [Candidatus Komeilibacteria bacterium]